METFRENRCILFDWGDTLMRVFPEYDGPMFGWPRVEAVAGAGATLAGLKPAWTLGLATNAAESGEAEILAALRRVDLDAWLDRIYCFKNIGSQKPSPEFFERILADLGMEAASVVMVGDDFKNDILAANACGIWGVWLNERAVEAKTGEMYTTIQRLEALPDALADLGFG